MITVYYGTINYNQDVIWVPAGAWCCIFLKFITTPEIQYGYDFLNEKIEIVTNQFVLPQLWQAEKPLQEINIAREAKLAEKINPYIKDYIHYIEESSFRSHIFRNPDLSIEDIAAHIKVPSSHIGFVFKYHCHETFSDFKKIIRIHDAIKLLENGYLKTSTIESLSTEVGFITYNTFNVSFKNITGVTTQEYIKRIVESAG
jgi:AraC-like DNA-binding protein